MPPLVIGDGDVIWTSQFNTSVHPKIKPAAKP
jgi:hypothetical protein